MAPRIRNFPEWARHVLHGIESEVARNPDDRLAALHAELCGYVPPARLAPGHLLMTTITSFATAVDVTISELRLEAFLPADAATAAVLNLVRVA
jgi:MmyB-like transcription regulator ligand binding domain